MLHLTTASSPDLLSEWRWLLGGLPRLIGWSSAGDLFYSDEPGRVWRLDAGAGEAEVIADSAAAFDRLLGDPSRAQDLLLLPVVDAFEDAHGPLGEGRCLGFTKLPVFGGAYSVENRYAIGITEYAAFTGDVHRQIRDLPDGAVVHLKIVP